MRTISVLFYIVLTASASLGQPGDTLEKTNDSSLVYSDTFSVLHLPLGPPIWKDSSVSSVSFAPLEDGSGLVTSMENQTYLHVYPSRIGVYDDATVIISQNVKWRVGPWDGNAPQLMATCYLIRLGHPLQALWEVQLEADEGRLAEPFYHAVAYGCCGGTTSNTLFNLRTGETILEYTEPLLIAELPYSSGLKRYIAYKRANAWPMGPIKDYERDTLYVGTLYYASKDSLLSELILGATEGYCANSCDMIGPFSIKLVALNPIDIIRSGTEILLNSASSDQDQQAFDNVAIEIVFDATHDPAGHPSWDTIFVQIVGDRMRPPRTNYGHFSVQAVY